MLARAYYDDTIDRFLATDSDTILGKLSLASDRDVTDLQRRAWVRQIDHLRASLSGHAGHIAFEFVVPRVGKRADVVLVIGSVVYVLEYKAGASSFDKAARDQVFDYALDLKNFHAGSHQVPVVPILIATEADSKMGTPSWHEDLVADPVLLGHSGLPEALGLYQRPDQPVIDAAAWFESAYSPTPTIVEAAKALFGGHQVSDIAHSESGATNLEATAEAISTAIDDAKARGGKAICFVTGVPGSGKTLAGLNVATRRQRADAGEHAVFLSGNGPLVDVLREALARDAVSQAEEDGQKTTKKDERRRTNAFIQNVHHFRDECLLNDSVPPIEKVAIFDEAQRAWDARKASKFMKSKKGVDDFNMSEPEFLLEAMDRHDDWCVVVCLVGGGQEINDGEAGIGEWLRAVHSRFSHWQVYRSDQLGDVVYKWSVSQTAVSELSSRTRIWPELHLDVSVRSFRAESLSKFVENMLEGDAASARAEFEELAEYPLVMTRSLSVARSWLRSQRRGGERIGLVASSNAIRLQPDGVFVQAKPDPVTWFLNGDDDIRSSYALEDVASEFDTQGLELDWAGLCWDANLRWTPEGWDPKRFRGTKWQNMKKEADRRYLMNAYRVNLTRARQGLVIFVPRGDIDDVTRLPEYYDRTAAFLADCGIPEVGLP
jgi:hypothetical protein